MRTAAHDAWLVYSTEEQLRHLVAHSPPVQWTERQLLAEDARLFDSHPQLRYLVGAGAGAGLVLLGRRI